MTLFVTSIGGGGSHATAAYPNGCVLAIDAGVRGIPEPIFDPWAKDAATD